MNKELTVTRSQERSGAAAALLSLDGTTPFFAAMGVPAPDPRRFVRALRDAIVENRREFQRRPERIPDLEARIEAALDKEFGPAAGEAYRNWLRDYFVHSADDFRSFRDWHMVLALSRRDSDRWDALHLPKDLSDEARIRLERILDRKTLHRTAEETQARPLSGWDIEMYTLHGFDDDENDPHQIVLETIKKRRFVEYLKWLAGSLSPEQRREFRQCADALRERIETTSRSPALPDPAVILEPYGFAI